MDGQFTSHRFQTQINNMQGDRKNLGQLWKKWSKIKDYRCEAVCLSMMNVKSLFSDILINYVDFFWWFLPLSISSGWVAGALRNSCLSRVLYEMQKKLNESMGSWGGRENGIDLFPTSPYPKRISKLVSLHS